ncbi:hypothetical protein [Microbacterium sp. 1.5R]|uniref:hypothetical protein n=1 Tax=Microbacterium sp. 1.5R TaxID=1916917 RepID=UPI0012FC0088|nr:hypothetical protein [Microbacterium sp. 1.5R]
MTEPVVIAPAYSYSYGWETPDPTWTAATDGYSGAVEWAYRSGVYGFYADGRAEGTLKRTFTQLTPGRTYTASVWLWSNDADTTVWLNTSSRTMGTTSWVQLTNTFTPTSSSFEVVMKVDAPTFDPGQTWDWFVQFDDFTLTSPAIVSTTADLQLSEGDLTLDSSRYPYAEASVEVPFTSEGLLDSIKPGQRVTLAATSEGEHVKVYTPWVEQRRNLIANPTFRTNTNTWTAAAGGGAAATITRAATLPAGAIPDFEAVTPGYARITYTTTGTWFRAAATTAAVVPGQPYTLSGWMRGAPAGVAVRLFIQWRTSGGSLIYEAASPNITLGSAFERMSFTDVAPANAAYATIQYGRASAQVGDFFDLTGTMFEAADAARDYYDGATSNDEFTQTRWLGTADASTSVLETRTLERVDWVPAPGITADLALRSRKVSHDSKKITLSLASDEWMLERWAPIADDSTPRTHEENLRNLINYVLNKAIPGAALQPGTTNAAIPASWDATNLMTNPTAGLDLSGWSNTQGTISRLTTGTFPANTSLASAVRATMNAGADRGPYFNGGDDGTVLGGSLNVAIREKQLYRVSMYIRTSVAKTARLIVTQRNSANATAGRNLHGPNFTTTANTWTRVSYVFQAYPGAVRMGVFPFLPTTSYAAGNTVDVTGVMVTEGTLDHSYFDGGTVVRPDLYTYTWNDQAHVSTSERTAIQERRPELFTWKAGQTAWDFLKPLVASAGGTGLRLFCDEQRRWWLINPIDWSVPGRFSARADNAVEGTDTMDADDEDNGVTGVVARFTWTDVNGVSREKVDAAGVAGKVKLLEFDREYPGPGVAAAHLKKTQGLGRVQDVTVETDYAVRPGQEVQIDLPGTSPQLGTINRVQWELTNGLMSIGSAGLRETPVGAIDLLNTTIDGLTGSIDSL